jgi:4-amino-4-deoxy-L-arabinose transferase-like glycosyltransferase
MLQAYMVLPAFGLLILLNATTQWRRWTIHLVAASLLMLVLSLGWAVAVDMTPVEQRPYVASSETNSVLELMTGHNGLARLLPGRRDGSGSPPGQSRPSGPPPSSAPPQGQSRPQPGGALSNETGDPGLFRLFNRQLAGQVMWLLPLAGFGAFSLLSRKRRRWPLDSSQQATLFWLAWLLPQLAFFSVAGLFHRYYLEMLAPALAALVGAGVTSLWRDYTERTARAWLLPVALLSTAGLEIFILGPYPAYRAWLAPVIGMGSMVAVGCLWRRRATRQPSGALALGMLALLIAPTVWAWIPVWHGGDGWLPFAGPDVLVEERVSPTQEGSEALMDFLQAQHQGEIFLLATTDARIAAPLILATGKPVMALGGFSGQDAILTSSELAAMVRAGDVRFFLLPGVAAEPSGQEIQSLETAEWVIQTCERVPTAQGERPGLQLWDCQ